MNPNGSKPQKKIDELRLLVMIRKYTDEHMGWPPTAATLFEFRLLFAPSLSRIDTLRMWLLRHRGRTIRILAHSRPYRYELTRQGQKRMIYLQKRAKLIEDFNRQIDFAVKQQTEINKMQQLLVNCEMERREKERARLLLEVIESWLRRTKE